MFSTVLYVEWGKNGKSTSVENLHTTAKQVLLRQQDVTVF